ncbi:MAG: hypothetical protein JXR53_15410 [Bacteroidales bacterium]|nr:hypothetical protein [Bacteroidales bacterium]
MSDLLESKSIDRLFDHFLTRGSGSLFFSFANADGKRWIMPRRNLATAMHIYQPSSLKGKFLKRVLPYLSHLGFVQRDLKIEVHHFELGDELTQLFYQLFHSEDIEFSIFCGTPSVHQKITMQLSRGRKILGYCKLSIKKEVKELFDHEELILKELAENGMDRIPCSLYNNTLSNGVSVFLQSTTKTDRSKVLHSLSSVHWDFLSQLHEKTKTKVIFEDTDFYKSLQLLKQNMKYLNDYDTSIVLAAISKTETLCKGRLEEFSFNNADFTPWNMFVEKDQLFVFDWEYSGRTFPPFLDAFHFFTQTAVFKYHKNVGAIYKSFRSLKGDFARYIENPDFGYLCYLLSILSLYTERDRGEYTNDVSDNIRTWVGLTGQLLRQE